MRTVGSPAASLSAMVERREAWNGRGRRFDRTRSLLPAALRERLRPRTRQARHAGPRRAFRRRSRRSAPSREAEPMREPVHERTKAHALHDAANANLQRARVRQRHGTGADVTARRSRRPRRSTSGRRSRLARRGRRRPAPEPPPRRRRTVPSCGAAHRGRLRRRTRRTRGRAGRDPRAAPPCTDRTPFRTAQASSRSPSAWRIRW